MGPRVEPGHTTLAVMPLPARSAAKERMNPITACFDALYALSRGNPSTPAVEEIATTRPCRGCGASSSAGTAAATRLRAPFTLTSNCTSHWASGVSHATGRR